MDKKWMPITAGVLDVLNGACEIIMGLFVLMVTGIPVMGFYSMITIVLLLTIGVLAIVGGVYAFKRKKWCLVLAGAIAAFIPMVAVMYEFWEGFNPSHFFSLPTLQSLIGIPAIVAIVLTVLSRKQFEGR